MVPAHSSARAHTMIYSRYPRYMLAHVAGARGSGGLISSATYSRLHTPPAGADYALGWETLEETWADGRVLAHIGSNTVWYASVWLAPERDLGLFAVTNAGGDDAARATEAAVTEMIARLDRLVGS